MTLIYRGCHELDISMTGIDLCVSFQDKEVACGAHAPRILSLDDYFLQETNKQEEDPETGKKVKVKVIYITVYQLISGGGRGGGGGTWFTFRAQATTTTHYSIYRSFIGSATTTTHYSIYRSLSLAMNLLHGDIPNNSFSIFLGNGVCL